MSAWIRSVTGRAYHFEPLNAKQLERPSPFLPELRFLKALGVSWWKRPARGSILSQSSQRSGGFHKPAVPRAALGIATISPPCGSPQASFVRKSGRGSTGRRPHPVRSRSPTAETRRRERRQCRCESCREHHFGLQALK